MNQAVSVKVASVPLEIEQRDAADPLRHLQARFHLPQGKVYLAGNSLGPAPVAAFDDIEAAVRKEWAQGLVQSWNDADWFSLVDTLGDRIGALVGAAPGQTVACDSVSINVYKALHAGLSLRPGRTTIVAEAGSFPTDLYVAEGVVAGRPDIKLLLEGVDADDIEELIDERTAVVLVNHVDYKSGELRDMAALTSRIHAAGAIAVWDLCHSAGVIAVELDACDVDLAIGCTYKYLNCGPGAPAFIYAAKRHQATLRQPLSGWWGHAAPFAFEVGYRPDSGARRLLCGTQPILSLRALNTGLAAIEDVAMVDIRAKSLAMSDLFIDLVEQTCRDHGATIVTPRDHAIRGSQVSITFKNGYAVVQALMARGIVGDFRAPDMMRFGFAPAYLSFADVYRAADAFNDVMTSGSWREERFNRRRAVT
ncbi:kynureninase [Aminobacter aminovorans]|uniref:Kynureninase n=1 Tax=Aminobacter aminovorans TaxID=83263 RepID=A0A381IMU0_AMIAI|nr:kynureninase [Aminobacter aminovorans]TCS21513.1 kynureninase [Aminobacter aminovorans]SUY29205.1 Kynureninase [Aminobacter aminovorans]